jgi:hypothetical protein
MKIKGARDDDRQYRRGVVLGLTMAEIMLLLIFLLLLILGAKMVHERRAFMESEKARKEAQLKLEEVEKANPDTFKLVEDYRKLEAEHAALKAEMLRDQTVMDLFQTFHENNKKLTEDEAAVEMARLAELGTEAQALAKRLAPTVVPEKAAEEMARLAEIGKKAEEAAEKLEPQAEREEAIQHLMDAAEVGNAAMKDGATPEEIAKNASCSTDLKTCMSTNDGLSVSLAKKGGTLPSCWRDPLTQSIQYIFTAYLRSDGIVLEAIENAGRDRSTLPLGSLEAGKVYSREDFVAAGQAMYQWSERQNPACRFYVRAVDETGADKEKYVSLKEKGVEQIFFMKKNGK